MIDIYIIFAILIGHFIGDFVLQSDWMAKNKSSSIAALSIHVIIYTLTIGLVMMLLMFTKSITPENILIWTTINGGFHMLVDFVTSRLNKYLWETGNVHNFFVGVGFDQLIHYVCLMSTACVMLR